MKQQRTIRLTHVDWKLILWTILFIVLLASVIEWLVRQDIFQTPMTTPQMGSSHYEMGQKLAYLDRQIKQNGPVDCLMVGSSMVDVGFDPEAFEKAYQEITGKNIQCFNFGLDASSAASTQAIAKILVEDYHPRLLIVGTDARDYVLPREDPDVSVILDTPWVQYRLGNFSLDGWLLEKSYFYRYRQHLNRLLRFDLKDTLVKDTFFAYELRPNGLNVISKIATDSNDPPDPNDQSYQVQYYGRIFKSYQVLDLNLEALKQTLALQSPGMQVVVVEMPVPDGYYYFFGNGSEDHGKFIQSVKTLTAMQEVPFWQTEPLNNIPDNGWSDYTHMNTTGADVFSSWLGRQVGQGELNGSLLNAGE